MLVLTRKVGQQVLLAKGTIQIKVLKLDKNSVQLGLNAPPDIDIDREEIHLKKLQQEKATASLSKVAL